MACTPLTSQDLMAIGSLSTAVLALFATIWQSSLTREHNRKSTTPLLTFRGDHRDVAIISVRNDGVGPALIKEVHYFVDGQRCSDIKDFDEKLHVPEPIKVLRLGFSPPASLGAGQSIVFLDVRAEEEYAIQVRTIVNRAGFQVFYESVYGEAYHTEVYAPDNLLRSDIKYAT